MMKLIKTIRQWLFPNHQSDEPATVRGSGDSQSPTSSNTVIHIDSGGGSVIDGDVNVKDGGKFVGRDYIVHLPKPDPSAATAPSPIPDFVGRTAELDQLTNLLISGHSAAITALQGMGGIGKTALAQQLADKLNHQQPVHFSGGIFWASLELHSGSADPILREWAAYCGVTLPQELTPNELQGRVRGALALRQQKEGHLMAVLDDVRPEWEPTAHLLRQSLPAGTPLLITTREQYLADSLEAKILPLDLLPTADGVRLLHNIIQKPALLQDEILVSQLLDLLGNLPLAIRLAATYIRNFSAKPGFTLAHFVDQLQDQALKPLDTQGAERGLMATFSISYRALTPQQQHLFGLASIYSPPLLTLENMAGLLGPENALSSEMLEAELDELVNMALLAWHEDIRGRYVIHPLLSQYVYGRLQENVDDVRALHTQAACLMQHKVSNDHGTPEELLEEVDQWGKAGMWEQMVRQANALMGSLSHRGYWLEIDQRLAAALDGLGAQTDKQVIKLKGHLINNRGQIADNQTEWEIAIKYYEQALEMFELVESIDGIAQTYNNLGNVYQAKGEWEKAIDYYKQSIEMKKQVGDIHGIAQTYNNLGEVNRVKGEWSTARLYYALSLRTKKQVGDIHGIARTYNNLGLIYQARGEWEKAIDYYEQVLETFEQVGDIHGIARTYNNLGLVYQARGEWEKAIDYYEQALDMFEEVGDMHGMAQAHRDIELVYQAKGKRKGSIGFYEQLLKKFSFHSRHDTLRPGTGVR